MNKNRCILFLVIFIAFIQLLMQYGKLVSGNNYIADLGYFVNNIQYVGSDFTRLYNGHFQPILYLFNFLYAIKSDYINNALLIIYIQTISIFAFIYYLYENQRKILSILLIVNPVLYNYILFDFHFEFIAFIIIICVLIFLDQKKYIKAILISYALILIKEPYILVIIMTCIYVLLIRKPIIKKIEYLDFFAVINIIIFLLLFIYISLYLIPKNTYLDNTNIVLETIANYRNINTYLNKSYLISNVKYCLLILIPSILFIGKYYKYVILTFPLFLYIILNPDSSFRNIYSHYNIVIIAPWIYGLSKSLSEINNKKYTNIAIIISILMVITVSNTPISLNFYTNKFEQFSYINYFKDKNSIDKENKILDILLTDNSEAIIIQNNMYYKIFDKYKYLYLFPDTIINENNSRILERKKSNYIVLNTKKQPFYYDIGCKFIYGKCIDQKVENNYLSLLKFVRNNYTLIEKYNGIEIYKIQ